MPNPAGKYTSQGVLAYASQDLGTECRGTIDGNTRPQAFWVFSVHACGAYGFGDVKILHSGRTEPVGVVVLRRLKQTRRRRDQRCTKASQTGSSCAMQLRKNTDEVIGRAFIFVPLLSGSVCEPHPRVLDPLLFARVRICAAARVAIRVCGTVRLGICESHDATAAMLAMLIGRIRP